MGRLTRLEPVPVLDLIGLYRAVGSVKGPVLRGSGMQAVATLHATRCRSVGMVDEAGRLIAALLFYRDRPDDRCTDLAFVVRSSTDVRPFVASGIALARLTIAEVLQDATVTLRAVVKVDHPPGHRLASLVGFEPVDEVDGQMIYERTAHERVRGRHNRRERQERGSSAGATGSRAESNSSGAQRTERSEPGSRHQGINGGHEESAARAATLAR